MTGNEGKKGFFVDNKEQMRELQKMGDSVYMQSGSPSYIEAKRETDILGIDKYYK